MSTSMPNSVPVPRTVVAVADRSTSAPIRSSTSTNAASPCRESLPMPSTVTSPPVITPRRATEFGLPDTIPAGTQLDLYSGTEGASVAWTTGSGDSPRWKLYDRPLVLPPGTTTLRAKAVRYGFRESEETVVTVTVTPRRH